MLIPFMLVYWLYWLITRKTIIRKYNGGDAVSLKGSYGLLYVLKYKNFQSSMVICHTEKFEEVISHEDSLEPYIKENTPPIYLSKFRKRNNVW